MDQVLVASIQGSAAVCSAYPVEWSFANARASSVCTDALMCGCPTSEGMSCVRVYRVGSTVKAVQT